MDLHHAGVYNLVIYVVGFNQFSTTIPFTYSVTHQHPILFGQTQCVGFEPTRRINARPDSNRLQFHYGNTAEFSTYRQRTFIVLFPRFLSRQRFHHKKNIIHYTKTRQPCHINNILQRVGIAGIEPATTRI